VSWLVCCQCHSCYHIACHLHIFDRIYHRTNPKTRSFLGRYFSISLPFIGGDGIAFTQSLSQGISYSTSLPTIIVSRVLMQAHGGMFFVFCLFNALCWFQVRNTSKLLHHERALLARWFSGDAQSSRSRGNLVSWLFLNCNWIHIGILCWIDNQLVFSKLRCLWVSSKYKCDRRVCFGEGLKWY